MEEIEKNLKTDRWATVGEFRDAWKELAKASNKPLVAVRGEHGSRRAGVGCSSCSGFHIVATKTKKSGQLFSLSSIHCSFVHQNKIEKDGKVFVTPCTGVYEATAVSCFDNEGSLIYMKL